MELSQLPSLISIILTTFWSGEGPRGGTIICQKYFKALRCRLLSELPTAQPTACLPPPQAISVSWLCAGARSCCTESLPAQSNVISRARRLSLWLSFPATADWAVDVSCGANSINNFNFYYTWMLGCDSQKSGDESTLAPGEWPSKFRGYMKDAPSPRPEGCKYCRRQEKKNMYVCLKFASQQNSLKKGTGSSSAFLGLHGDSVENSWGRTSLWGQRRFSSTWSGQFLSVSE